MPGYPLKQFQYLQNSQNTSSMKQKNWTTSCTQNESERARETLIWLESVTEKETGNVHPGACVDVSPRCCANQAASNRPQYANLRSGPMWAVLYILSNGYRWNRFVSSCPPECNFQSESKIEPDLRLSVRKFFFHSLWSSGERQLPAVTPKQLTLCP